MQKGLRDSKLYWTLSTGCTWTSDLASLLGIPIRITGPAV